MLAGAADVIGALALSDEVKVGGPCQASLQSILTCCRPPSFLLRIELANAGHGLLVSHARRIMPSFALPEQWRAGC